MAARQEKHHLTEKQMLELAEIITEDVMVKLAKGAIGLTHAAVENCQEQTTDFIRCPN